MAARPSIVFASRELWPFVTGGGIGHTLHGALRLVSGAAEVTLITREDFREEYERMRAAGDPRLPHPDLRLEFIPEPGGSELGPFSSFMHCWSALVYERICNLYPGGGPDLAAFGDYMGEGFVSAQARRAGSPSLRRSTVLVRLHTSLEMVDYLDGRDEPDEERRAIYTLERGSIAHADVVVAPSQVVLDGYVRFYGEARIARREVLRATIPVRESERAAEPPGGSGTRLLYVGRLQRLKGVLELVQAARRLDRDDFVLTLVGGDTDTAPGGGSMREQLLRIADGDPRIALPGRVPLERVLELMDEHHAVVAPSHWECWSTVAREAYLRNRPVLAAPSGGLLDAVRPGVNGWFFDGTDVDDIERGLRRLLDSRAEIERLIASGSPRRTLDTMLASGETLAAYLALAGPPEREPPAAQAPPVDAVVICGPGAGPLARTLESLGRQTQRLSRVVVAAAGLGRVAGAAGLAVESLALEPEGASRASLIAAGVARATGELVLLVQAGMVLEPALVERLLEALGWNPEAAYATSWARGIDPSCVPFGNFANRVFEHDNAAVAPLVRRELFESLDPALGDCAERVFYAGLAAAGHFGCVVPERLVSFAPFSRRCGEIQLVKELVQPAAPTGFP